MLTEHFNFVIFLCLIANGDGRKFPDGFKFGTATAAYQVEGAWNKDGKGPSIWDVFIHEKPSRVLNSNTGDVACDSYQFYKRDIEMLKDLGVHFYRFSLSWSRILPTGFADQINPQGVNYYNRLIDGLLANGIEPYVTLYHWDLPQSLQDIGGWTNPLMIQYFEDYARVVYDLFGDRVRTWVTFNEPKMLCYFGYEHGKSAPGIQSPGIGVYLCYHNILRAHAKAYHLYKKQTNNLDKVGLTLHFTWAQPLNNTIENQQASDDFMDFTIDLFLSPVMNGDYPPSVKKRVAENSFEQGFPRSRLPEFSESEKMEMKSTVDFVGVNYYTSKFVDRNDPKKNTTPSFNGDIGVRRRADPKWKTAASTWLNVTPWALRKVLVWIKEKYNNPEMMILENGFSSYGGLKDADRVAYLKSHLHFILKAVQEDHCRVTAYTYWSLLDNFEWEMGYSEKFGLYEVDFNHPNKTRTPRESANVYKNIIRCGCIDDNYINDFNELENYIN